MSKINAKKQAKKAASTPAPVAAPAPTPAPVVEPTKPVASKRISHLKLGPALLEANATPEQIKAEFTASFNGRGVTDQAWIDKRTAIYMAIARKKAAKSKAS